MILQPRPARLVREKTETEQQLSSIVLLAGESSNIEKVDVRQGYEIVQLSREDESRDIHSLDRHVKDRTPQVSSCRLVNAKAKMERQLSSIVLPAGESSSGNTE